MYKLTKKRGINVIETSKNDQTANFDIKKAVGTIFKIREVTILIIVAFIGVIIGIFSPYFFTTGNLMGIAKSFSTTAIISIGMTMVIITGGIDLSVGSVLGLSSLLVAISFENKLPPIVCILVGLSVGVVFGIVNGLLITKVKLQPFIATLGTVSIGRGLIYIVTRGTPRTPQLPKALYLSGRVISDLYQCRL
jgi:ribose transport system permease protein